MIDDRTFSGGNIAAPRLEQRPDRWSETTAQAQAGLGDQGST